MFFSTFVLMDTKTYRLVSIVGNRQHGIITIAGIIDTDYRGEWIVGLLNTNAESSGKDYTVQPGDKIAQVELPFPYKAIFKEISNLEFEKLATERNDKGFGSSGR